jgi:hypothetical protein
MSEELPPITTQTAQNPAVHKVLDDGTVLYKTWQQAEAARLQKKAELQQSGTSVKKLSQAKYGEQYLAQDGKAAPYTLGNLIEFQFTGLIVVIVVLAGLSLICSLIGRLLRSLSTSAATAAAAPVTVTPPAPTVSISGIHPGLTDQQLVVLLTAAATEILGESVRVEKFRPLTSKDLNWAAQGRSVLQSHRLK